MKQPILALTILMSSQASAEVFTYLVKKGDTLSTILYDKLGCQPIYGRNGLIKKVLKQNAFLLSKSGNRIQPGNILHLKRNCGHPEIQIVKHQEIKELQTRPEEEKVAEKVEKKVEEKRETLAEKKEEKAVEFTYFKISPHVSWFTIDSHYHDPFRVSELSTVSASSPGLIAEYGLGLSEELTFFANIEATQMNFYSDPDMDIQNLHFIKKTTSAGVNHGAYSMSVGYSDKIFLLAPDVSTVRIEKIQVPEIRMGFIKNLWQKKNFTLATGADLKAVLPRENGVVNTSASYGAKVFFSVKLKNKSLRLFYHHEDNRSDQSDTTVSELGLAFTFETIFLED